MFKNIFRHIKSGMSLIELLVVITIIGILIGVLVPTIGNTQAKTRDITRQTQVQELAAALMAYKLDYGEFPIISSYISGHIGGAEVSGFESHYRGEISMLSPALKGGGYITKIPKDPANLSFSHTYKDQEPFIYNSSGYYLYLSDGKSFMIITPVEDEKNGNSTPIGNNIVRDLIKFLNDNLYDNFFNDDHLNSHLNEGSLYIYKYEEEIL